MFKISDIADLVSGWWEAEITPTTFSQISTNLGKYEVFTRWFEDRTEQTQEIHLADGIKNENRLRRRRERKRNRAIQKRLRR